MISGECLITVDKKAEALDQEQEEFYKFLQIEQGKQIDKERARIREELRKR